MLPKNFYDEVEKADFLKHILYSDSVTKDTKSIVRFGKRYVEYLTFDEIWNRLIEDGLEVTVVNNKEYIFIKDYELETVTYDIGRDKLYFIKPEYIMRHKIDGEIIRLNFTNLVYLDVTKSHSMVDYNPEKRDFDIKKPAKMTYVPAIVDTTYIQDVSIIDLAAEKYPNLSNIKPIKITSKETIRYNDYVYDFSIPKTQVFVANGFLVHNTDSLFVSIPLKDADKLSVEERLKIADEISEDINKAITKYLNEYLLPRSNISPDQNMTFFKSEMLMDAIMFLDVKKNYAYKVLAKKGKIFKTAKINYTGIQVVKSDAARFTQDLLKEIIENVILNPEIDQKDKVKRTSDILNEYYKLFLEKVSNLDLADIAFPGKWQKKDMFINGMKLYNYIMKQEIFSMGSAGLFIYCIFRKPKAFTIDISKTNGICVPYVYDVDLLRSKFEEFGIEIDKETQWNKLFTTTCQRVVELVKNQK